MTVDDSTWSRALSMASKDKTKIKGEREALLALCRGLIKSTSIDLDRAVYVFYFLKEPKYHARYTAHARVTTRHTRPGDNKPQTCPCSGSAGVLKRRMNTYTRRAKNSNISKTNGNIKWRTKKKGIRALAWARTRVLKLKVAPKLFGSAARVFFSSFSCNNKGIASRTSLERATHVTCTQGGNIPQTSPCTLPCERCGNSCSFERDAYLV